MPLPADNEQWRQIVSRELVADAERRLKEGQRLYEGRWVSETERERLVREARRRLGVHVVELVLLWGGITLLGLLLMMVAARLA